MSRDVPAEPSPAASGTRQQAPAGPRASSDSGHDAAAEPSLVREAAIRAIARGVALGVFTLMILNPVYVGTAIACALFPAMLIEGAVARMERPRVWLGAAGMWLVMWLGLCVATIQMFYTQEVLSSGSFEAALLKVSEVTGIALGNSSANPRVGSFVTFFFWLVPLAVAPATAYRSFDRWSPAHGHRPKLLMIVVPALHVALPFVVGCLHDQPGRVELPNLLTALGAFMAAAAFVAWLGLGLVTLAFNMADLIVLPWLTVAAPGLRPVPNDAEGPPA